MRSLLRFFAWTAAAIAAVAVFSGNIEKLTGVKPFEFALSLLGRVSDAKQARDLVSEADRLYFETADGKDAVQIYQSAADLGDAYSKAVLAKIYHQGFFDVGENQQYAAQLAIEAFPDLSLAAQEDPSSAYALGYLYEYGIGLNADPAAAIGHYEFGARAGHAPSQNLLGIALRDGKIAAADKVAALSWLLAAANQGHRGAMVDVGIFYRFGWGTSPNIEKSIHWLTRASELGQPKAQAHLAEIYENGELGQPDLTEAEHWYSQAAAQDEPYSMMKVGAFRWNRGEDRSRAYREMERAAELGDPIAQLNMARFVATPERFDTDGKVGIVQDYDLSLQYYEDAAKSGLVEALDELSAIQVGAFGLDYQDFPSAFENATACAQSKSEVAAYCQLRLAYLFSNGLGTQRDLDKAEQLYREALEGGVADAALELSKLLLERYGVGDVSVNQRRLDLLLGAIQLEPSKSAFHVALGHLYRTDLVGVDGGMEKAADAFEIAAELGSANAACNLGFCYLHGSGRPQDFGRAIKWMTNAAERGLLPPLKNLYALAEGDLDIDLSLDDVDQIRAKGLESVLVRAETDGCTANSLAQRFERGDAVDRDIEAAVKWYLKAAELGSNPGAYNYARLTIFNARELVSNPLQSRRWLESAAESGSGPANLLLAIAHYNGKFGNADINRSERYLRAAKDLGAPFPDNVRELLPREWVTYYTGQVMSCEGALQAPVSLP